MVLKGIGVSTHGQRLVSHTGCVFPPDGDTAHTKHKADLYPCCGGLKGVRVEVCTCVCVCLHTWHAVMSLVSSQDGGVTWG